jgi:hypothetical protein
VRAPLVFAFVGATLLIFLLSVLRVRETEIALDLAVSELAIKLPDSQELTPALSLGGLGITGAEAIEIPHAPGGAPSFAMAQSNSASLRVEKGHDGAREGTLDLDRLVPPQLAQIRIRTLGPPGSYRISLSQAPLEFHVSVSGPVRLLAIGEPQEQRDFDAPKSILVRNGDGTLNLDLDLALDPAGAQKLAPTLDVESLVLQHIDPPRIGGRSVVRAVSTIEAGVLYWEAFDDKQRTLRPYEMLAFEQIHGQISALRLDPEQIHFRFQGEVRGMFLGAGDNRRSLMPTWLEWIRERHGLSLFWASALYLFGLAAGVVRWWNTAS